MNTEKLYIKNMVCDRCKLVIRSELEKLFIEVTDIELGTVVLNQPMDTHQKELFVHRLEELGFALLEDKKHQLIDKIKTLIVKLVHYNTNDLKINLSDYLSTELPCDYNYMSNLFSEIQGTTIEKYFIAQKIEKVKELLIYDELNLNEIAFRLNYSSASHLSNQFKKVTGLSPSVFKQTEANKRKPLDKL